MESEQLREIVKENNQLEEKLTKRNQQYIFDLKKSLEAANLSEEEKVKALTTTPTKDAISIVPSSAILFVPERDATIAPRVVRSTGVALRNIAK